MNPIAPSDFSSSDKASLPTCSRSYNTSELNRVTRSLEQHADVTLVTAEGDKVTLSSGSQAQMTYATYEDLRYTRGCFAEFHSETFGLEVSREYSILVDGDLNEKELRDIRKAVRAIEKIMRDFLSGDIAHAAAKAMKISQLESISSLDASLQFERSLSVEQQVTGYVASEPAEPRKGAHSPQLAAGLARVSENGRLPYGRRFPVPTSRDCRDLQSRVPLMTAPDTRAPTSRNGFTLLEILLALSILATVLSTVFASYTGAFRLVSETEAQAEIYQMARVALERILEDLESFYLPEQSETSEAQEAEQPFEFASSSLRFPSRAHLVFGEEDQSWGTTEISYYVEEGDGGEGLILFRRERPQWGEEEASEEGEGGLPLCEKLWTEDPVKFSYYDAEGKEMDNWDPSSEDQVLKRVSVALQFINPSDPEAPLEFATSVYLRVIRVDDGDVNADD